MTTHIERLRVLKKNSKCVKFWTKSTHFEKNKFKVHQYRPYKRKWKEFEKRNFACLALFVFFQNSKVNYKFWKWIDLFECFIPILHSFVRLLKYAAQLRQPIQNSLVFMSFKNITFIYRAFQVWVWPLLDKRSTR